ncbi:MULTISPECIES: stage III sporulation protein AF [Oceanobacillus]|uniref:Stage III sporulation protein AF n=1 Tax=Oceanobacillus kimchii TaxID=746691 RepID=A0ABQ5TI46_9BACI|nr:MULTISPECIES: stage III sporulation protein AF [Oceanobacillus]MBT2598359.1 stage III sporulation protein AF [Oceanobacillus sp. ISL-74]MBT2651277.1 stage III sporulation protein AF [Oceanobacillus sp. ISL-73]MCT1575936.1 stage III sporulation protein AF [Oceanobacillus kimchii]MCT2135573.1 stage III sporulation protein AF [Oceanobacillus kimchii]GLO66543.1 stage III sporulation protein AF [Oceanobacillus kimchii]
MNILIDWVTQIIIFIIIASIIDLLIPANDLKKYVRLVTGLVLILIILQPVFHLFNTDIDTVISSSISEMEQQYNSTDSLENQIEFQKNEIEASQDAYILEQMAVQLENVAEDPLKEEYNMMVEDIEFRFTEKSEVTFEDLTEVIVFIKEAEQGEGAVDTVEDVVIDSNSEKTRPKMDFSEMEMLLMELWEITDKKVTVYWEGGTS